MRRTAVLLTLAGLLTPAGSGVVVAFHLSAHHATEHHEEGHDHTADLSVLWHGHAHETTTPEHDHPLLGSAAQALRVSTTLQSLLDVPRSWPRDAAFAVLQGQGVSRLRPYGFAGVGPPPRPGRPPSILRI